MFSNIAVERSIKSSGRMTTVSDERVPYLVKDGKIVRLPRD